jgi:hypothetical protein
MRIVSSAGRPGNLRYTPVRKMPVALANLSHLVCTIRKRHTAVRSRLVRQRPPSAVEKVDFQQKLKLARFFHREIYE